jgi:long-subunit fatty acid transport protein
MNKIILPATVEELQLMLKSAIEDYTQCAVKNQNKLNEVTAHVLGFKNHHKLNAANESGTAEYNPATISAYLDSFGTTYINP